MWKGVFSSNCFSMALGMGKAGNAAFKSPVLSEKEMEE